MDIGDVSGEVMADERGPILKAVVVSDRDRASSWDRTSASVIWLTYPLVALTRSPDLFDYANDLFVEAKLPGLSQCAARKDLLSGHQRHRRLLACC